MTHSTHNQMQAKWEPVRAEYLKLADYYVNEDRDFFEPLLKLGLSLVGSAVAPLLGDLAGGVGKKIKH